MSGKHTNTPADDLVLDSNFPRPGAVGLTPPLREKTGKTTVREIAKEEAD
ncbi:MAG: hypothetical protein ACOY31_08835 [Bacillota bacterium]